MATAAPSAARWTPIEAPMPLDAPVTTATFPLSFADTLTSLRSPAGLTSFVDPIIYRSVSNRSARNPAQGACHPQVIVKSTPDGFRSVPKLKRLEGLEFGMWNATTGSANLLVARVQSGRPDVP